MKFSRHQLIGLLPDIEDSLTAPRRQQRLNISVCTCNPRVICRVRWSLPQPAAVEGVLIEKFQNFSEPGDVLCSKDWLIPELSPVLLLQIHNVWSLGCVLWLCVLRVTGGRRCRKDKPTHCPKYEVNLVGAPSRFVLLVKNREAISQRAP